MGYYLLDRPPARRQFYPPPRENPLTGGVAVHTTESILDRIAPDTGAENVADFIRMRPDAGSYHVIVDTDSTMLLLPDDYTAFHIKQSGHNSRTYGIAMACRTTDLDVNDPATIRMLEKVAWEAVQFWKRNGFDAAALARTWVPNGQTLTRGGFFNHGDAQPADRTDAFVGHPQRPALQNALSVLAVTYAGGLTPAPEPEDDDVSRNLILSNADGRGEEFLIDGQGRLLQRWQGGPNGGWGNWIEFRLQNNLKAEGALSEIAGFRNADGRLEIVVRNRRFGYAARAWQQSPGAQWAGWVRTS